jgi:hypothetical protein
VKPFNERKDLDDLEEEEILDEYKDVIDNVRALEENNIDFRYDNSCVTGKYCISIYAKYDVLKKENQDIFFDKVMENSEQYEDFYECVKETLMEQFPSISKYYEVGYFEGRSGGHFNMYFSVPSSIMEIQRYIDRYISYDLQDVNYELVWDYSNWLFEVKEYFIKYLKEYWDSVCEFELEMMTEEEKDERSEN